MIIEGILFTGSRNERIETNNKDLLFEEMKLYFEVLERFWAKRMGCRKDAT